MMCLINIKTLSNEVVSELAVKNKAAEKIYDSYNKFYKQVSAWYEISEKIYFNVRWLNAGRTVLKEKRGRN